LDKEKCVQSPLVETLKAARLRVELIITYKIN